MEANDMKAMREALDAALVLLEERQKLALCRNGFVQIKTKYCDLKDAIEKCRAALAAPPRNCDVGTAEEQAVRFDAFVQDRRGDLNCTGKCPAHNGVDFGVVNCVLQWTQTPYEEGRL